MIDSEGNVCKKYFYKILYWSQFETKTIKRVDMINLLQNISSKLSVNASQAKVIVTAAALLLLAGKVNL